MTFRTCANDVVSKHQPTTTEYLESGGKVKNLEKVPFKYLHLSFFVLIRVLLLYLNRIVSYWNKEQTKTYKPTNHVQAH
jgi:hypothetical protein